MGTTSKAADKGHTKETAVNVEDNHCQVIISSHNRCQVIITPPTWQPAGGAN
jgi:PHD/YefM family antitoxin component YafN of YafNO toxin-antitoxin module